VEQWYCIYTKPREELQAAEALEAKGVDVFLPVLRLSPAKTGTNSRKPARAAARAGRPQPLFPRYLFVHADFDGGGFAPLNWTPGVVGLVSAGGQPVAVPAEMIDLVRRKVAEYAERPPGEPAPFRPGERVVIQSGPFAGMEAVFRERDGRARARVLVEFLRRQVRVELDLTLLHKLDPRAAAQRGAAQRGAGQHGPAPRGSAPPAGRRSRRR
jgi:transcriptional antiterminator RfaH